MNSNVAIYLGVIFSEAGLFRYLPRVNGYLHRLEQETTPSFPMVTAISDTCEAREGPEEDQRGEGCGNNEKEQVNDRRRRGK